jgi:hypothetical protein
MIPVDKMEMLIGQLRALDDLTKSQPNIAL